MCGHWPFGLAWSKTYSYSPMHWSAFELGTAFEVGRSNAFEVGGCCHQNELFNMGKGVGSSCTSWSSCWGPMQTQVQDHPASYMQLCTHYVSHQLKQVSSLLLGACVVRSSGFNFRVWPTHLLVLMARRCRCSSFKASSSGPQHVLQACVWTIMWACVLGPSCCMQTCSG